MVHTYNKLSRRIEAFMQDKQFKPGDKMPSERALSEIFEVSRSSVREAIRILTEKGLLESRRGDGTYVCALETGPLTQTLIDLVDKESIMFDNVMDFRRAIEPAIAALAAERCTPDQLARLKVIACEQQLRHLNGDNDGELDAQFHEMLAECTGNPLFVETMRQLNAAYSAGRMPELRDANWKKCSIEAHLRLICALEQHNPAKARAAAEEHLRSIVTKHLFSTSRD